MCARPRLNVAQPDLQAAILEVAWRQCAEVGPAALSLRAIARDLGITAPAIYNYYPSRDDLVTALIIDGFASFGAAQAAAIADLPAEDYPTRLRALGLAYREWAVTHPERYLLIFNTPIAGYCMPVDKVGPVSASSLGYLATVLAEAYAAGRLRLLEPPLSPALKAMLDAWVKQQDIPIPDEVLYHALATWGHVHGLVALELCVHYPPFITDAGAIYRQEIDRMVANTIRDGGTTAA